MIKTKGFLIGALALIGLYGCSSSSNDVAGCNIPEHNHDKQAFTLEEMGLAYTKQNGESGYKNLHERDQAAVTLYYKPSFYFAEDYFLNPITSRANGSPTIVQKNVKVSPLKPVDIKTNALNGGGDSSEYLRSKIENEDRQTSLSSTQRAALESGNPGKIVPFMFDRYNINKKAELSISEIRQILKENPNITLVINGRTDSIGTENYNFILSQRRAESVKEKLLKSGISPQKIKTVWQGEKNSKQGPKFTIAEVYLDAGASHE